MPASGFSVELAAQPAGKFISVDISYSTIAILKPSGFTVLTL